MQVVKVVSERSGLILILGWAYRRAGLRTGLKNKKAGGLCFVQQRSLKREAEAFLGLLSYIFPENFIEIPHVIQEIRRFSSSILTIFINFIDFLIFCKKS